MKIVIKCADKNNFRDTRYECLQLNYKICSTEFVIPVFYEGGFEELSWSVKVEPINILFVSDRIEITFEMFEHAVSFSQWLQETDGMARDATRRWLTKVI